MRNGKHALFLVADSNQNLGDVARKYNADISLPYEQELENCIKSWRTYGGDYSEIPIYVVCPSLHGVSPSTIKAIENLGAWYWHEYQPEVSEYLCGYWNVPLAGKMLESNGIVQEEYLIHIDLDMALIKNPYHSLFELGEESLAKFGINEWRPTARYDHISPIYPHETNTGFIVSRTDTGFYHTWYDRLKELTATLDPKDPAYSIYEERVVDIMFYEEGYPFEFVDKYQVNGDVSDWSCEDIDKIVFFHGHYGMRERNEKYYHSYLRRTFECMG